METISSSFGFNERSTSFSQEIRAGIATFLTMSYIILVNPQILSDIGISPKEVGNINLIFIILYTY
jgi:AGZA family xanthine/uracil permease-like MFS transporter